MKSIVLSVLLAAFVALPHRASADDRAAILDAITRATTTADAFARTAAASDDRAVRKKLAPKATDIVDDLTSLGRRARKDDVPMAALQADAASIARDTAKLIDLVDEASDKTERKALRAQAQLVDQALAQITKQLADAKAAKPAAPRAQPAMAPGNFKQLVDTASSANTDAQKFEVINAAGVNWFNANQIGVLMDLINTEAQKVNVASALWPHLVDPQNGFVVFGKLELEGSKAELRRRTGAR